MSVSANKLFTLSNGEVLWDVIISENEIEGAGCSRSISTAKQIALAEFLERKAITEFYSDTWMNRYFMLDEFPSSAGFALGFSQINTRTRALFEGLEKWVFSMWFDYDYEIEELNCSEPVKDEIYLRCKREFNYVRLFKFAIPFANNANVSFYCFFGFYEKGIFKGSSVNTSNTDGWRKSSVEALRHLINYKNGFYNRSDIDCLVTKRAAYFSCNAKDVIDNLKMKIKIKLPKPQLKLAKTLYLHNKNCYISRYIINGMLPSILGNEKRFIY